jgi:hypothetical protein
MYKQGQRLKTQQNSNHKIKLFAAIDQHLITTGKSSINERFSFNIRRNVQKALTKLMVKHQSHGPFNSPYPRCLCQQLLI